MTLTPMFWMGFVSGVVVAGATVCFVMAAINFKRSNEAANYITRGGRS